MIITPATWEAEVGESWGKKIKKDPISKITNAKKAGSWLQW
jgi:hypothetical protein